MIEHTSMAEFFKKLHFMQPIQFPQFDEWLENGYVAAEQGKLFVKIIGHRCPLRFCTTRRWKLLYVVRTTDDDLIIFLTSVTGEVLY